MAGVPLGAVSDFLRKDLSRVTVLGREMDDAYMEVAATAVLDPAMLRGAQLKVVYSNIHGTGAVHCSPLLIHAGCSVVEVVEQLEFDPRFPTVKSPNPENAEALSLAIARRTGGGRRRDGDRSRCDRMGVAVRDRAGKMILLTGNQIGSLMA